MQHSKKHLHFFLILLLLSLGGGSFAQHRATALLNTDTTKKQVHQVQKSEGKQASTSNDFLDRLTPGEATIISSVISALIAIFVLFLSKHFENKKYEHEKYDAVKKYANPIIFATEQLAWRLREILNFNGAYLLPNAPQNGFFKYKFDSTVYRLCAVLGWIQAAKKEQSYIEGIKVKQHRNVQAAITKFHKLLADGSHLEVSILNDLAQLFNIKLDSFNDTERVLLGVELEKIVFSYISDSVKKNIAILNETSQVNMVQEIMDFICDKIAQPKVSFNEIKKKRVIAINEISREYCWIYRDWQSAIGDEMIEIIENANRRFDVIGFAKFQEKHDDNIWLKKVDNLFSNLDVSVDDKYDTRVGQLKQVFEASIDLIETFKVLVKQQETISEESLKGLKDFNKKISLANNPA